MLGFYLLERGISVSEIAKTVHCHRSTVYRELKWSHYCPDEAQMLSIKIANLHVSTAPTGTC
ncbi:helix-turn-helix domain-containing protein [Vibrio sp. ES.051]|uniref:helix-turn-helix domain-containing protein n=1 Tax=Vibrio sp. ES.051 TaxID=1761909 RepID=UPI003F934BFF